jgi:glycosyltransferase involved in cell wall biosynthesis
MATDPVTSVSGASRLVLLQPTITGLGGHEVEYLIALGRAAQAQRLEVTAWVNTDIAPRCARALSAAGIEINPVFAPCSRPNLRLRVLRWLDEGLRFLRALCQSTRHLSAERVVLSMLGSRPEYLLAASLYHLVAPRPRPLVMLFFGWNNAAIDNSKVPMGPLFAATRALARSALANHTGMNLAAQSTAVAEELEQRLGVSVASLPMVVDWASFPPPPKPRDIPGVGYIGALVARRGAAHLLDAIDRVRTNVRWEFDISMRPGESESADQRTLTHLRERANVRVNVGPFTPSEYKRLLVGIDILALPYDPKVYRNKTSGIFAEAVGLEKIVVVPDDTWMADIVAEHGIGVVYEPYTSTGLAAGIDMAVKDRHYLARNLTAFAPNWRAQNSASAFVDQLMAVADDCRHPCK